VSATPTPVDRLSRPTRGCARASVLARTLQIPVYRNLSARFVAIRDGLPRAQRAAADLPDEE
jgi:hypothetical protein